jgi:pantoate kinase
MKSARAFAPGNISCLFKIVENKDPRWMGSLGLGFTINEGVMVEVIKSKEDSVFFNEKQIDFPTVKKAAESLTDNKVEVRIKTTLPLGCGFGLSGASALATSYAINKLLDLGKTNLELAVIAHTAEVVNKTGLGDVVNQYLGGVLVKFKPSSCFEAVKIPLENKTVYCKTFGELSTKNILADKNIGKLINESADNALEKMKKLLKANKKIKLSHLTEISKEFTLSSGILNDTEILSEIEAIEKIGGNASMIMLGRAIFSDRPFEGARKFLISDRGAYVK